MIIRVSLALRTLSRVLTRAFIMPVNSANAVWCLAVVFVVSLGTASGQVPQLGHCPSVNVAENFDLDAYMGIWYEYEKYPFLFEFGRKCNYAKYTKTNSTSVAVINASIKNSNQQPSNVTGTATVVAPGKLSVKFRPSENNDPNYLVLDTDYTSYAVVFSCKERMGVGNTQTLWVLTRVRKPQDEDILKARKVIEDNQLSTKFLMKTNQELCPVVE